MSLSETWSMALSGLVVVDYKDLMGVDDGFEFASVRRGPLAH